jgi:hypothetical protein
MVRLRSWSIGIWAAALVAGSIWAALELGMDDIQAFSILAVAAMLIGGYLIIRVPSNLVGTALFIGGSAWLVYVIGIAYATASLASSPPLPAEHLAAWLGSWVGVLLPLSLSALLILFPDGRLTRGGRWLGLVLLAAVVVVLVGAIWLWSVPIETIADTDLLDQTTPYQLIDLGFQVGFFSTVPAAILLLMRYRVSQPTERRQMKWLLYAASIFIVVFAAAAFIFPGEEGFTTVFALALAIAGTFIPISVAFSVVKYRLYDIDRIISRTLAYAALIGVLGLALFGLVVGLGAALGRDNQLVVAVSTLAVAALFNPVRRRVFAWVDRRFNRSKYDSERVISEFAGSLRDRVDPDGVIDGWVGVVSETMQPSTLGVWVK